MYSHKNYHTNKLSNFLYLNTQLNYCYIYVIQNSILEYKYALKQVHSSDCMLSYMYTHAKIFRGHPV